MLTLKADAGHLFLGWRLASDMQTTPFMFDGAKAELSKSVSLNPAFQVSHSFQLGGQAGPAVNPGTYNFAGVWGSDYVSHSVKAHA